MLHVNKTIITAESKHTNTFFIKNSSLQLILKANAFIYISHHLPSNVNTEREILSIHTKALFKTSYKEESNYDQIRASIPFKFSNPLAIPSMQSSEPSNSMEQ